MPIYKMAGKKDGLQKYRVRLNYVNDLGEPKQLDRVAYGLESAKELELKLKYDLNDKSIASGLTINRLFNEYIVAKKYEVRETTLDKSIRILELHILPFLGNIKLNKLDVRVFQKWKLEIEQKDLSLKTKQNIFSVLRALLNYAVKMEYIIKNPLLMVGNFKDAYQPKKEMDYYTADEFKKFINVALKMAEKSNNIVDWHYYVFFNIAFYTGMRKGEIHALKWSDIEGDRVNISRSIAQKLKGGDRETPPKNKSSIRILQIPQSLLSILNSHHERCSEIDGFNDNMRICGCTCPLRDTSIDKRNRLIADIAGVKRIRIHDFRHSHASLLVNNGINIQEIARRLGHSKIEITWNTYSHLYPAEEEKAVKVLDNI